MSRPQHQQQQQAPSQRRDISSHINSVDVDVGGAAAIRPSLLSSSSVPQQPPRHSSSSLSSHGSSSRSTSRKSKVTAALVKKMGRGHHHHRGGGGGGGEDEEQVENEILINDGVVDHEHGMEMELLETTAVNLVEQRERQGERELYDWEVEEANSLTDDNSDDDINNINNNNNNNTNGSNMDDTDHRTRIISNTFSSASNDSKSPETDRAVAAAATATTTNKHRRTHSTPLTSNLHHPHPYYYQQQQQQQQQHQQQNQRKAPPSREPSFQSKEANATVRVEPAITPDREPTQRLGNLSRDINKQQQTQQQQQEKGVVLSSSKNRNRTYSNNSLSHIWPMQQQSERGDESTKTSTKLTRRQFQNLLWSETCAVVFWTVATMLLYAILMALLQLANYNHQQNLQQQQSTSTPSTISTAAAMIHFCVVHIPCCILSIVASCTLTLVTPSAFTRRQSLGFVGANPWLLLGIQKLTATSSTTTIMDGMMSSSSSRRRQRSFQWLLHAPRRVLQQWLQNYRANDYHGNASQAGTGTGTGVLPNLPFRLCDWYMGRLHPARSWSLLAMLLAIHLVVPLLLWSLVDAAAQTALAFVHTALRLFVVVKSDNDCVAALSSSVNNYLLWKTAVSEPQQQEQQLQSSSSPSDWVYSFLQEMWVVTLWIVGLQVLPTLFRLNKVESWWISLFLLYPLYNVVVHSSSGSGNTTSSFSPSLLLAPALLGQSNTSESTLRSLQVLFWDQQQQQQTASTTSFVGLVSTAVRVLLHRCTVMVLDWIQTGILARMLAQCCAGVLAGHVMTQYFPDGDGTRSG